MPESLEEMWNRLSLTEEEQNVVVVEKEWVDDGVEVGNKSLLGKLLLRRSVNIEAMRLVFLKIWRIKSGLTIREVGERLFLFYFEDELERDKVYQKQPWSFNKSLLVLNEFDGHTHPENVNMEWCPFNVQIHGLPLDMMTGKIGTVLGESIGDVEEVDSDDTQKAWGRWLKVRVALNISKPLKRGKMLSVPEKGKVLASFRYEHLPDFCYICGRLDHQEHDCDEAVRLKKEGKRANREYGAWLRAEGPASNTYKARAGNSKTAEESSSSIPAKRNGKQEVRPKENEASSGGKHIDMGRLGEKSKDASKEIQERSRGSEYHQRSREERPEIHGGKAVEPNTENRDNQQPSPHKMRNKSVSNPNKGAEEQMGNWDRAVFLQNIREESVLPAEEGYLENGPINNSTNRVSRNKKQASWKRSARKLGYLSLAGDTALKANTRKRANEDNEEACIKKQKGMEMEYSMEISSGKAEVGGSQPRRSL